MFTELLLTACLQSAVPAQECKEFSLLYDARDVSPVLCSRSAMIEVARWSGDHPSWTVKRWRCGLPRSETAI